MCDFIEVKYFNSFFANKADYARPLMVRRDNFLPAYALTMFILGVANVMEYDRTCKQFLTSLTDGRDSMKWDVCILYAQQVKDAYLCPRPQCVSLQW